MKDNKYLFDILAYLYIGTFLCKSTSTKFYGMGPMPRERLEKVG